jgi:hypothetical protein
VRVHDPVIVVPMKRGDLKKGRLQQRGMKHWGDWECGKDQALLLAQPILGKKKEPAEAQLRGAGLKDEERT